MPNNIVKSFAKRSGKSVGSVEKMWKDVKSSLMDQGVPEGEGLFKRVTGILKKNLKLK